jgi:hypothetical protein
VTVFNKRNALVGFLALKMLKRRRRKQLRRKAPKIALFSLLGLASLGAVVGIVAVLLRRRGDEDLAGAGEVLESEIIGDYVIASSETIPAT